VPKLTQAVLASGSLNQNPQPVLGTAELTLRPWEPSDAADVVAAYADPDIQRWHGQTMTADEAANWVRAWPRRWSEESAAGWAVTGSGQLLGRISLNGLSLSSGLAHVAYWVLPVGRGRGVASRALREVTRWAFHDLGLHRLELEHSTRNEASCRVAARGGYELEGTLRQQGLHLDGWHDMHLHATLAMTGRP